jgi:hypothetical protein
MFTNTSDIYLFISGSFNDDVISSDYIMSYARINE